MNIQNRANDFSFHHFIRLLSVEQLAQRPPKWWAMCRVPGDVHYGSALFVCVFYSDTNVTLVVFLHAAPLLYVFFGLPKSVGVIETGC